MDTAIEHAETLEGLIDGERDELGEMLQPIVEYLRSLEGIRSTRFIMLDKDDKPIEKYHQDDESDVCEGESIIELLDLVGYRVCDMDMEGLLEDIDSGDCDWRVVRQELITSEVPDWRSQCNE